ncbi:MAG: hypothetical protein ACYC99_04275 [Candidatus Geothermincolia bacterium]
MSGKHFRDKHSRLHPRLCRRAALAITPLVVLAMVSICVLAGGIAQAGISAAAPPVVTRIEPATQHNQTSFSPIIEGSNFTGVNKVWLSRAGQADIVGTAIIIGTDTSLMCTMNLTGAQVGKWSVNVRTLLGTGTLADGFTVIEMPPPPPPPFTWFLAEGSTDWGFSCYITIENPNNTQVNVEVTYMPTSGANVVENMVLPASSQTTLTNDHLLTAMGGKKDFSTVVYCTDEKTIAADRTMIWTGTGAASPEAHNSIGVTGPAKVWYLPEGSSAWGFECWLLIANPNAADATCQVTYMIEGVGPKTITHVVPGLSRRTYSMVEDVGSVDASIKVDSNIEVVPERAMYRYNRREGHDSIGVRAAQPSYSLAEGTTAWGFTTFILIQNPNDIDTQIDMTYMTNDGPKPQLAFVMPPNTRKTIRVNDTLESMDFSTLVEGSNPIIAERAMYWNNGTGEACHDSVGTGMAQSYWYLPDGESSGGRETWTLVQNPGLEPADITITYLTPTGAAAKTVTDTIDPESRKTYNLKDVVPDGRAAIMVTTPQAVIVERAMYWNNRGAGTDTLGGWDFPPLL